MAIIQINNGVPYNLVSQTYPLVVPLPNIPPNAYLYIVNDSGYTLNMSIEGRSPQYHYAAWAYSYPLQPGATEVTFTVANVPTAYWPSNSLYLTIYSGTDPPPATATLGNRSLPATPSVALVPLVTTNVPGSGIYTVVPSGLNANGASTTYGLHIPTMCILDNLDYQNCYFYDDLSSFNQTTATNATVTLNAVQYSLCGVPYSFYAGGRVPIVGSFNAYGDGSRLVGFDNVSTSNVGTNIFPGLAKAGFGTNVEILVGYYHDAVPGGLTNTWYVVFGLGPRTALLIPANGTGAGTTRTILLINTDTGATAASYAVAGFPAFTNATPVNAAISIKLVSTSTTTCNLFVRWSENHSPAHTRQAIDSTAYTFVTSLNVSTALTATPPTLMSKIIPWVGYTYLANAGTTGINHGVGTGVTPSTNEVQVAFQINAP
jgi:hypothetical protein